MSIFLGLVMRDASLAFRSGGGTLPTILFFALAILIYALAIGPELELMRRLAAPILWASATLSCLVSLDRLFQADADDGTLDILMMRFESKAALFLAKTCAHWLTTMAPLIIATPVLALLLNLPTDGYWPLLLSLLVGAPGLSLIGSLAAALTLGLKRANVLVSILTAPLFTPILIFGVMAASDSGQFVPSVLLLAAVTLVSLIVAPLAGAWALKAQYE